MLATALPTLYWIAPIGAVVALVMARVFTAGVLRRGEGTDEMKRIAGAVREGAMAYLARQYRVVAMVFVALVVFLGALWALGLQPGLSMLGVPVAGLLSGLCGWFGMSMATRASSRTAHAASTGLNEGLRVAFRSGAVMGLNVVGFALLDISAWLIVLTTFGESIGLTGDAREITTIMLSFGMGASTQALFARVGGGIYTKAADVGADLVGKVEAGIPEDDARNPATIADNVGDNVGDVAGMGADLYESYYGSILATMALGAAAAFTLASGGAANELALKLAVAPAALAGIGILCSIVGILSVRTSNDATFAKLLAALGKGVYVASGMIIAASVAIPYVLFGMGAVESPVSWLGLTGAIVSGLVAGLVIARFTEYYTSYEHPPTRRIALQAHTGPATVIIAGIAEGMRSTWASILSVVIAILVAFVSAGGADSFLMGLYGVSLAAVGMLSTLGITLATDAYGPIADNAGGNAEMAGLPPGVRQNTDLLDSLGNTTAATGKGFAIGSAALTALALLAAYVQVVATQLDTQLKAEATRHGLSTSPEAAPSAVYVGNRTFSMVVPGGGEGGRAYVTGLMLVEEGQFSDASELDHFPKGLRLQVRRVGEDDHAGGAYTDEDRRALARAEEIELQTTFDHGDHKHEMTIRVVPTARASIEEVLGYYDVTLTNPRVLSGLFIGVLLTFLFCAMTMSAVGRAAYAMMRECRRQFGIIRGALRASGMSEAQVADPESWPKRVMADGKEYPDYATCVSISTAGAQREMVVPSILAITVPIVVGLVLSVPGVVGMLAGGLTSGFAVAVFMANAGGAWDNAKKYLESFGRIKADDFVSSEAARARVPEDLRESLLARAQEMQRKGQGGGYVYGKGSEDHKATVVGDTVGDPFKDTSGPSLNILVKLISIVSVVFAGLVVKFGPIIGGMVGLD